MRDYLSYLHTLLIKISSTRSLQSRGQKSKLSFFIERKRARVNEKQKVFGKQLHGLVIKRSERGSFSKAGGVYELEGFRILPRLPCDGPLPINIFLPPCEFLFPGSWFFIQCKTSFSFKAPHPSSTTFSRTPVAKYQVESY